MSKDEIFALFLISIIENLTHTQKWIDLYNEPPCVHHLDSVIIQSWPNCLSPTDFSHSCIILKQILDLKFVCTSVCILKV